MFKTWDWNNPGIWIVIFFGLLAATVCVGMEVNRAETVEMAKHGYIYVPSTQGETGHYVKK